MQTEHHHRKPMFTTITTAAALLAGAAGRCPLLVLLWATESREQRARRWRRQGLTQQAIADRLGCSRRTVGRLLTA
jgi:CRP-like cAMP-binding protein